MQFQHQEDNGEGSFYLQNDGATIASIHYHRVNEDRIIIDHTEVDASLSGKGVGKQLVAQVVELARHDKVSVVPMCRFARKVFDKVEEYHDVL